MTKGMQHTNLAAKEINTFIKMLNFSRNLAKENSYLNIEN